MEYQIKQIDPEKTYEVRHPVLRAGRPITACTFEGDALKTTVHIGIFSDEKLLSVCSFFQNKNPLFSEISQYQLRGMAVLKPYQSMGLGHAILKHGEQLLKTKNANLIWCNARQVATKFYLQNGYEIIGKPFTIKSIGLHYIMRKAI